MSLPISTAGLAALLAGPDPVTVLDARTRGAAPGRAAFAEAHLPGAVHVDLAAPPSASGACRHPLPDPDDFAATTHRCGVRGDRPVLVYDD